MNNFLIIALAIVSSFRNIGIVPAISDSTKSILDASRAIKSHSKLR